MDELPLYSSALKTDGTRDKIRLADVSGRFQRWKSAVFLLLTAFFVAVPFVTVRGERLFLIDIARREFYLFGLTFNAQDVYLIFFLLTGFAFTLFFVTTLLGRLWCGWACPQTVFLEGFYRKIERWIEGPRASQLRLAAAPWSIPKTARFAAKHLLFILLSLAIAGLFVLCFVPHDAMAAVARGEFAARPVLATWWAGTAVAVNANFAWFREQLCLIVCPYGRLQSVLTDDDTLVIGYDRGRGEPRAPLKEAGAGHCVDCGRCVVVCPTGIDIRNGLQMECVGCANCIDACDQIMDKVGRPRGLIRYDSLNGLEGRRKRFFRPRVALYSSLLLIGMGVFGAFALKRKSLEANLLRLPGPPYVLSEGKIRNQLEVHLFNKRSGRLTVRIEPRPIEGVTFVQPIRELPIAGMRDGRVPLFVEMNQADYRGEFTVVVDAAVAGADPVTARIRFLGPSAPSP